MRINRGSIVLGILVLFLVGLNAEFVWAHRWSKWHQNRGTVGIYNFATRHAEANAAIDDWNAHLTEPKFAKRTSHTHISVFDGNFGPTGWWGLASIEDTGWDWWCWWWCAVSHGHARYNSYYGGTAGTGTNSDIRGVLCQEIGHLLGLGHSNDGCMGKGYYNSSNVVVPHNAADAKAYTHP